MYVLIGIIQDGYQKYIDGKFETEITEEKIALFTSEEKAMEYVNKFKLKHPKRGRFGNGNQIFKTYSPLGLYSDYRIEEYEEEELEINPS